MEAVAQEGRLRQPRGDDRRPAHQPQILCQDARGTDAGDGARNQADRRQDAGPVHRLPRLPYGIREIPAETAEGTTTAYYNQGSPENGIAGTYYVNTSKLDQRPLWEIPPLTVHEAVPGHHHQIALQQEMDMPAWRRNGTFFTAFVEGWGLYSERLGIEMGLYDTPGQGHGAAEL